MRGRMRALWLCLVVVLMVSAAHRSAVVTASPDTTVYVDPKESSAALAETFNVDATVREVTDLFLWELRITFSPNILQVVDLVEPYPPAEQIWIFIIEEIDNTDGWIHVLGARPFGVHEGLSGTWKLVTVVFNVIAEGGCTLHFDFTELRDVQNVLIDHDVEDGYFMSTLAPHVADLVGKSAWPERHHFDISKHLETQTFHALVRNKGTQSVTFQVVFEIWTARPLAYVTSVSTIVDDLGFDETRPVSATWTVTEGKYKVFAQCFYDSDGDGDIDALDVPGKKIKRFSFAVVP